MRGDDVLLLADFTSKRRIRKRRGKKLKGRQRKRRGFLKKVMIGGKRPRASQRDRTRFDPRRRRDGYDRTFTGDLNGKSGDYRQTESVPSSAARRNFDRRSRTQPARQALERENGNLTRAALLKFHAINCGINLKRLIFSEFFGMRFA